MGYSNAMIQKLFYLYVSLLIFEIPIRSVVLDSSLIRDIPLILILMLIGGQLLTRRRSYSPDKFDYAVLTYIAYGLFSVIYHIVAGNADYYTALWNFRNFYLPVSIYFIVRSIILTEQDALNLYKFISKIFVIATIGILIERVLKHYGQLDYLPW